MQWSALITDAHKQLLQLVGTSVQSIGQAVSEGMLLTLNSVAREFDAQLEQLSAAFTESTRKQLKAQQAVYEIKLAQVRTASTVQLKNQACELEAQQQAKIEQTVKSLVEGGDTELSEAYVKIDGLRAQLETVRATLDAEHEELTRIQKKLETSETRAGEAEEKLSASRKENKEIKEKLKDKDEQIEKLEETAKTFKPQLQAMEQRAEAAETEIADLQKHIEKEAQEQESVLSTLGVQPVGPGRSLLTAIEEIIEKRVRERADEILLDLAAITSERDDLQRSLATVSARSD